tara:strand:- start:55 stop:222 length:168 start_codon:yes stop_codon:yes gene_type:complete
MSILKTKFVYTVIHDILDMPVETWDEELSRFLYFLADFYEADTGKLIAEEEENND